ncbi:hypothetical protein, partial [Enterobacter cloacae]
NCGSAYGALPTAVRQGLLREAELDAALVRVLSARRDLGIAFGAHSPWSAIRPEEVATPGHHAVALEAARKSIVLLRNEQGLL